MKQTLFILLTGVGATAATDLWALIRRRLLGAPLPNYALVGRWIAHLARGQFRHTAIAQAAPASGEFAIGWLVHYSTGIAFASLPLVLWGTDWMSQPTLMRALLVGFGTVAAPFLIMQPAMGLGIAAHRTPRPWAARLHSLVFHGFFGLGLYASAAALSKLLTGE